MNIDVMLLTTENEYIIYIKITGYFAQTDLYYDCKHNINYNGNTILFIHSLVFSPYASFSRNQNPVR